MYHFQVTLEDLFQVSHWRYINIGRDILCNQQVVGSNPTQAQCNFSSEELHWVSHGVVSGKCEYYTNIISWLLSPPGLSGGPY